VQVFYNKSVASIGNKSNCQEKSVSFSRLDRTMRKSIELLRTEVSKTIEKRYRPFKVLNLKILCWISVEKLERGREGL
jgi:predicted HTH domain antitoxin